jgi:hypothetical protein
LGVETIVKSVVAHVSLPSCVLCSNF